MTSAKPIARNRARSTPNVVAVPVVAFERIARWDTSFCGYCAKRTRAEWIWQMTHRDGHRSYACAKCFILKKGRR